jgi:trimeric autotransporter adhesin
VTRVPVASVSVTPSPDTLVVLQQLQLTATPLDASGNPLTGRTITWDGSNDNVATVSSNGRVTALSPGSMTVSATAGGKTGTATIVVVDVPVASVELSPTTQSVVVGQNTPAFTAVTKDAGGHVLTGRTVTFNSDNTGVATIDQNSGVATGVSAGTAHITATSEGKTSNAATLTVNPPPVSSVTVDPPTQTITDGATATFTATLKDAQGNPLTGRTVTWDSSDHSVATIDNSGVATSTGPGSTTITATSEGKSGTATLQVDPAPVSSVAVTPPLATISAGGTVQLTAAIQETDDNGHGHHHAVAWDSNNTNAATVDKNGLVTGVALGVATITASTQGKSGFALITVLP